MPSLSCLFTQLLHKNAFAERLASFGFNIFPALVVDFMHEFELGVLKSALKHLIWILYVIDPCLVSTLNERSVSSAFLTQCSWQTDILLTGNGIVFLRYHHSGLMESAVFRRVWLRWDSRLLGILKTCCRYVLLCQASLFKKFNSVVLDPSFWWPVPWKGWCHY